MNIKDFKNRLNISQMQWKILVVISGIWLLGCFSVFLPPIRSLIIAFGEMLVHRGLNQPVWHERFISWGISGIFAHLFFSIVLLASLYEDVLLNKKIVKNLFKFIVPVITVFIVFLIMYHANWTFSDDHEYITSTAINKYVSPTQGGGRFYPLGHLHYNLPLFLFRLFGVNTGLPVIAHYFLIALFYVASVICLYLLFKNIEPFHEKRHLLLSILFIFVFHLSASSFVPVFMSIVFPETEIIMLLSVFMLCYFKAQETDKTKYYISALLAIVYSTYCKEPIFGVFLIIALVNLIFRYKEQTQKEKLFNFLLILNAVIFVVLYYFLSYKKAAGFYNHGRVEEGTIKLIATIFLDTKIFMLVFGLGFIRLFCILFKRDKSRLYYDGLLFGGMGYVLAYIVLKLNGAYYFSPAVVLSLPSLVYWVKYLYEKKIFYAICFFTPIIVTCVFNFTAETNHVKNIIAERQKFMPYINSLAEEYNSGKIFIWYESDNAVTANTFYKAVRDWRKHTENAFLNYVNKTEQDYFLVTKKIENLDNNDMFFYPKDNDQGQPMPDSLIKILTDNNFILDTDLYGIHIYKARD